MTTIRKGYRITVKSWENDGDNNKTVVLDGLSKKETQLCVDMCRLLDQNSPHSNLYGPSQSELDAFRDACWKVYLQNPGTDMGNISKEDVLDYFVDALYDLGLTCGEFYTRVCEKVVVEEVPFDVTFTDVTSEFNRE